MYCSLNQTNDLSTDTSSLFGKCNGVGNMFNARELSAANYLYATVFVYRFCC